MPSHELAAGLGRLAKKSKRSHAKPHFDLSQDDSDGEPYEETYDDDFIESDEGDSEPQDSECIECGSTSCTGKCAAPEEKKEDGREPNGRHQRSRFFMVTEYDMKATWFKEDEKITFVAGQAEICPETKREHFQLYVEVKTPITFKTFKARYGNKLHVQSRKGTQEEAEKYCTKTESRKPGAEPFVLGERASGSGKTSEQARAIQAVKEGKSLKEVARDHPGAWVRSYKGLTSLAGALQEERKDHVPIKALCLWGPPGGGKTWAAVKIAKVC